MQLFWQYREGRKKLIVFCNGWGMDAHPFMPLDSNECDILHLYDFSELPVIDAVLADIAPYSERILLSWSMGVWAGQHLFDRHGHLFSRAIAVNGTLCPVDTHYGIPRNLFAGTMAGWSELSRRKFYRRLTGGGTIEQKFLQYQPQRSLTDQQRELAYYLSEADCISREQSIYREVVISDNDRIVPTANQLSFWGEETVMHPGGHFPFYRSNDWEQFLSDIHANES
ncbi:DUF452 family protein [Desulfopila aestuarii]|uniref:Biotin synthesis protein BioG n=1 Tax=Desulfopila aestuarii DSM 18488 TaxID=1121416 RepID=A0A1M7Y1F6_9BACT|nr:pimeloyl-ACP methyl esterase BioG family protein [Desulfopila aestuarii]SHO45541.1 biotin synthesis protein BioG [Desulfopila aestuarii DSM 18488]